MAVRLLLLILCGLFGFLWALPAFESIGGEASMGPLRQIHLSAPQGKAACEIDTTDELVVTELMFNGCFGSLDKHQLVALVSCFVPTEKSQVRACMG